MPTKRGGVEGEFIVSANGLNFNYVFLFLHYPDDPCIARFFRDIYCSRLGGVSWVQNCSSK